MRALALVLLIACGAAPGWPCSCRGPRPACAYLEADAIFLGRVIFTNHDAGSGISQETLVRFDVEEIFKGLPRGTKDVWIDPGSFTSCYEEYLLGQRYLIVARRTGQMPRDSATMTVISGNAKQKPLPPGFDPVRPPVIYSAPECSGSRPADGFPHIEVDLAMLRAYGSGQRLPRVFGWAYLEPFYGWPRLDGPALKGAQITLTSGQATFRTTTLGDGTFSLDDAPAGIYTISAELPPLVPVVPATRFIVPEVGCGSSDVALRTTSELRGVALDRDKRPVAHVPIYAEVISTSRDPYPVTIEAESDALGRFAIVGVPESDVRLSYGSTHPSSGEAPYPLVYFPDAADESRATTLRLAVGERRAGMVLQLPPTPKIGHFTVRVVDQSGRYLTAATVLALLNGIVTEFGKSGGDGAANVPCLEGFHYDLEASPNFKQSGEHIETDHPVTVDCGKQAGPVELRVNRVQR